MPVLIEYLLKVSIALVLVYLFYQLLLRRLTFYNWNRWYLAGYSLLCFVIPFMNITDFLFRHELEQAQLVQFVPVYNLKLTDRGFEWNTWTITLALLAIGMLIMGVRMLLQLFSLRQIKAKAKLLNDGEVKLFDVDAQIVPFSFNNGIYINSKLHSESELKEIIRHEFVHVKQRHSFDILLAEILCTVLWFNPIAWFIRKAIRQNLEFIADEKVLQDGVDKKQYQYLLLKVVGNTNYSIAPNFNFSSLKNRIIMMNQIKSARVQAIRFLFVLPLIAVLLLAFRQVTEKEPTFNQQTILLSDTIPAVDIENVNVNKNNGQKTVTITLKNGITETYDLNDEKQLATFEKKYGKLDKLVPPPPAPPSVGKTNLENKQGAASTINLRLVAPTVPQHESVELNEKGYYLTIADNLGECIVVVKDKKKNIVEALKLTDWNKNEAAYEKKYGKIPPPPPPAPAVVSTVSIAASPSAVSAPASVNVTSPVSQVEEVTVTGYAKPTTVTLTPVVVEGKPVSATATVKPGAAANVNEVTVTGYATKKKPLNAITVEGKPSTGGITSKKGNVTIGFGNGVNTENVLYILNGREIDYRELEKIDVNTIENISVIKGENAEKAYGEKGKNGVILIKTKSN